MDPEQQHARRDSDLADAIRELTAWLRESRDWRRELKAMEARIISAIQGASSADLKKLTDEVRAASDPLKAAINADKQ